VGTTATTPTAAPATTAPKTPAVQSQTSTTPAPAAAPGTTQGVTDPYQLLNYFPAYTQKTSDELAAQVANEAQLKYNAQLQALARSLEQQQLSAQNQTNTLNTAYATAQEQVDAQLQNAYDMALRNAIARGGGQSGAVEWMAQQNQEPILTAYAQAEAERANQLAQIASQQALTEKQYSGQVSDLATEQANWQLGRQDELSQQAMQNALAAWSQQFQAATGLSEFEFQKEQAAAQNALSAQSIAASRSAASASAAAQRAQAELSKQELAMNQALKEAALTGYYNGTPTMDYSNQAWQQLMDLSNLMGYAYVPGTDTGTLTTGADTSSALAALSNLLQNYTAGG